MRVALMGNSLGEQHYTWEVDFIKMKTLDKAYPETATDVQKLLKNGFFFNSLLSILKDSLQKANEKLRN